VDKSIADRAAKRRFVALNKATFAIIARITPVHSPHSVKIRKRRRSGHVGPGADAVLTPAP
jgi:hypothetical protein